MRRVIGVLAALVMIAAAIWLALDVDRIEPQVRELDTATEAHGGTATADPGDATRAPVAGPHEVARVSTFRVVDAETDQPIAGVDVFGLRSRSVLGTTGPDGCVELPRPVLGDLVFTSFEHVCPLNTFLTDDTLRMHRELVRGARVDVRLHPDRVSRRCMLRFLGRANEPVAFATCAFAPAEPVAPPDGAEWRAFQTASLLVPTNLLAVHFGAASAPVRFTADEAGLLEIRFAAPGRYHVAGDAPTGEVFLGEIDVRNGGTIEIRARDDAAIRGIVVDRSTGGPIAGARVHSPTAGLETRTLRNGSFALGPTLEPLHLQAEAFGYAPATAPLAGPAEPVRFELEPLVPRVLDVEVFGVGAAPIAGAKVACRDGDEDVVEVQTSTSGHARLEAPVDAFQLAVTADGYVEWRDLVSARAGRIRVDLVPAALADRVAAGLSARIAGRVVDRRTGAPRAAAIVRARLEFGPAHRDSPQLPRGAPPRHAFVVTDSAGSFEIECWAPGRYALLVDGDEASSRTVDVALGSSIEGVEIVAGNP